MDVFDFAGTLSAKDDVSCMREFERTIFVIVTLESEVNNGGFEQFYFNSSGALANQIPSALERIKAPIVANIVRRANSKFGSNVPEKRETRQFQLEQLEATSDAFFDDFDDEFLAYPEDLANLLQQYFSQHTFSIKGAEY